MVSEAWKYFNKVVVNDKKYGDCKKCHKRIACPGSSTNGLFGHVKSCEKIDLKPFSSRPVLTKMSLNDLLAKLTALDGYSIRSITQSETLRMLFENYGHSLPKSASAISEKIKMFHAEAKYLMIAELAALKAKGEKFGLTGDEWCSNRGRRYYNLNVHHDRTYCLGMMRLPSPSSAETLNILIMEKLKKFGIDSEDIAGKTTDGCSWMVKLGTIFKFPHQICQNHSIHLSVCDLIYAKKDCRKIVNKETESIIETETETDGESEGEFLIEYSENEIEYEENIEKNLQKLRILIKFLKYSSFRYEVLKRKIHEIYGSSHDKGLLFDNRTRWNSVFKMIKRFLDCLEAVKKTLEELNCLNMLAEIDLDFLKSLSDLLEVVADAAVRLEKPNTTILECDIIMETLVSKLKVAETDISSNFAETLISRYEDCKNVMLVSLSRYLHNPDFFKNKNHTFFYASKKDIQIYASKLFDQLFATKENSLQ
nr:uncharacterized protein LOC124812458 [Hydra vulgaris]